LETDVSAHHSKIHLWMGTKSTQTLAAQNSFVSVWILCYTQKCKLAASVGILKCWSFVLRIAELKSEIRNPKPQKGLDYNLAKLAEVMTTPKKMKFFVS
jgi:hypothetical protein